MLLLTKYSNSNSKLVWYEYVQRVTLFGQLESRHFLAFPIIYEILTG